MTTKINFTLANALSGLQRLQIGTNPRFEILYLTIVFNLILDITSFGFLRSDTCGMSNNNTANYKKWNLKT